MSSERKTESNRANARKSTGPKTNSGKLRASRNAWRHGWAVVKRQDLTASPDAERLATAICDFDASPALYEQAVIIAECHVLLLKVRAARIALIEKTQGTRVPVEQARGRPDQEATLSTQAADAIRDLKAKLAQTKEAHSEQFFSSEVSGGEHVREVDAHQPAQAAGHNIDAPLFAQPEWAILERYERRALSRRNHAIRMFAAISTVTPFLGR